MSATGDASDDKSPPIDGTVSDPLPLIDPDEMQIHRLYRERIVQEDNLINHRMQWMIFSQALLLALWGAFYQKLDSGHPPDNDRLIESTIYFYIITVIGCLFSYGSFAAIRAAQKEIRELRRRYLCFYSDPSKLKPARFK